VTARRPFRTGNSSSDNSFNFRSSFLPGARHRARCCVELIQMSVNRMLREFRVPSFNIWVRRAGRLGRNAEIRISPEIIDKNGDTQRIGWQGSALTNLNYVVCSEIVPTAEKESKVPSVSSRCSCVLCLLLEHGLR
jgi:hypothetical protein